MEIVTVKFEEVILKKIDKKIVEHNFNSRTEFIREAVRDKLDKLGREELINGFLALHGKGKNRRSGLTDEQINEIASNELFTQLEKRFR